MSLQVVHNLLHKLKADFILASYGDGTSVLNSTNKLLKRHLEGLVGVNADPVAMKENVFALHSQFSLEKGIKTPLRRVRTRLYFTRYACTKE